MEMLAFDNSIFLRAPKDDSFNGEVKGEPNSHLGGKKSSRYKDRRGNKNLTLKSIHRIVKKMTIIVAETKTKTENEDYLMNTLWKRLYSSRNI